MTAVDVDALDKLREAATTGPWRKWGNLHITDGENRDAIGSTWKPADAALIVAAVNALPDLIAEVRRGRALREALADLTEAVGRGDEYGLPEAYRTARAVLAAVDGGEQ